MKLWVPGNVDADGDAVVEPLHIEEAGPDFLTAFPEARVSFPDGFSVRWIVEDAARGWLVRRRLTVTLVDSPQHYRLVSSSTRQVVPQLVFAQDLARSVYEACGGALRQHSWWLR